MTKKVDKQPLKELQFTLAFSHTKGMRNSILVKVVKASLCSETYRTTSDDSFTV